MFDEYKMLALFGALESLEGTQLFFPPELPKLPSGPSSGQFVF